MSTPDSSSSSDTRIPIKAFSASQTNIEATNTHTKIVKAPTICPENETSALVNGTAKRPHKPTTPCTEIAPTGSSILSLRSSQTIDRTTITPPPAATARLAKNNNTRVIPYSFIRTKKGYSMSFEKPILNYPTSDPVHDATVVNKILEKQISKSPEQYLWIHRRFKTRPNDEKNFYKYN